MKQIKRKKIAIFILSTLILVAILGLFFIYKNYNNQKNDEPIIEEVIEEVVIEDNTYDDLLEKYNINNDFVCDIVFDSNLINDSVVKASNDVSEYTFYDQGGHVVTNKEDATGNDVYIWTNWKTMEYDFNDHGGSIFMDYRNNIDDQNLIIYGHHFSEEYGYDPQRNKAFTPLEKLMDKSNYEDNKYVELKFLDETRRYELVGVYTFNSTDDYYWQNLQYYRTNYNFDYYSNTVDDNYYSKYIEALNSVRLYDTGISLTESDKTLTLQTCISGRQGELYEICVFKQISL